MKSIQLHGTQVRFPDICLICLGQRYKEHKMESTFVYGRRSMVLSLMIPLCQTHYKVASSKSRVQVWCERLAPIFGFITGVIAGAALLGYWMVSEQGSLPMNIPIALFVGTSAAVLVWAILYFWVAPQLASTETKDLLKSVRIAKYDPFRQIMEVAFANETAAELTARENQPNLIA